MTDASKMTGDVGLYDLKLSLWLYLLGHFTLLVAIFLASSIDIFEFTELSVQIFALTGVVFVLAGYLVGMPAHLPELWRFANE